MNRMDEEFGGKLSKIDRQESRDTFLWTNFTINVKLMIFLLNNII